MSIAKAIVERAILGYKGFPYQPVNRAGDTMTGPLLQTNGGAGAPTYSFSAATNTGMFNAAGTLAFAVGGADQFYIANGAINLRNSNPLKFSSNSADLVFLYPDAANNLVMRNGVNAQTFNLAQTYTDASNFAYLQLNASGGVASIFPRFAGTGSITALQIGGGNNGNGALAYFTATNTQFGTNSANWQAIDAAGIYSASTTPATLGRAGNGYGKVILESGSITTNAPAVDASQTWNNAATTFTGIKANVTDTASNAGSLLLNLQVNGNNKFGIGKDGSIQGVAGATPTLLWNLSGNLYTWSREPNKFGGLTLDNYLGATGFILGNNSAAAPSDVIVVRDGPGIFAQRNGVNAQSFKLANTWTDASNNEYGGMDWITTPNTLTIGTTAVGTGVLRALALNGGGNITFKIAGVAAAAVAANSIYSPTNGGTDVGAVGFAFKRLYLDYTNTGVIGSVTINKAAGRVNAAAAATSLVVTNSLVTAASHVNAWPSSADSTARVTSVVPAAGSFTINMVAPTAQTSFDFLVINAD